MPEIGATLNEARLRRKLDLMKVESDTKIRARYLRALEEEEFELLPGPTYVKTFLRTYGEYLDLDAKLLVEEYKQRYERPTPQELTPFSTNLGSRRERRRARGPIVSPGLVVGVCVVAVVGALAAIGLLWGPPQDDPATTSGGSATSTQERQSEEERAVERRRERAARRRRTERKRREAAARRRVGVRIVPAGPVNVCLLSRTGARLIDGQTLTERSRRYVGRSFKVTFGNGDVRMQIGDRAYEVPDTTVPIGYELRPRRAPRQLPADQRPVCS